VTQVVLSKVSVHSKFVALPLSLASTQHILVKQYEFKTSYYISQYNKYIISLDTSGIGVVMVRVLATNVATLVV
jgi:hypothetical protein